MARPRNNLRSATRIKLEKIARMEICGQPPREIAAEPRMQPDSVRELVRLPQYAVVREKALERVYGPLDKEIGRRAAEILERAAPDAARALAELLSVEDDNVTRRLAARDILDRSGHGPIHRKAVRQRHELDAATIRLISEAMREADMANVIPQVVEDISVQGLGLRQVGEK